MVLGRAQPCLASCTQDPRASLGGRGFHRDSATARGGRSAPKAFALVVLKALSRPSMGNVRVSCQTRVLGPCFYRLFALLLWSSKFSAGVRPMCGLGHLHRVMGPHVGNHGSERPRPWAQALPGHRTGRSTVSLCRSPCPRDSLSGARGLPSERRTRVSGKALCTWQHSHSPEAGGSPRLEDP